MQEKGTINITQAYEPADIFKESSRKCIKSIKQEFLGYRIYIKLKNLKIKYDYLCKRKNRVKNNRITNRLYQFYESI
ncbi:unnamed protein product [Paramecium octaurelia]|uniref:Uncharacterized protein n=1 Tax=Paramecium octaurelia TaxID=43137 RepID=A0A8S1S0C3_PAROT|nr:unnamed protein product [Paramecium octaurelia]